MNWEKDYTILKNGIDSVNEIVERHGKLFQLEDLDEYSFEEIISLSTVLRSAQGRTSLYEKKLASLFNWNKVSASQEQGDYIDVNNEKFELKISSTNQDNSINIDQIRLWQDIDYYLICYVDIENKNLLSFKLSKEQMLTETEKFGKACHGTKKANQGNSKIEYSFKIPINNTNKKYLYFKENYLYNLYES